MDIDWTALFEVALVSFAFGVGIVAIFSIGIVGVGKADVNGDDGTPKQQLGPQVSSSARTAGLGLAGVCFTACTAAILYGLWLIIPQFH
jgi:hypothetical protein